jgi:hypothetical protein
MANAPGTIKFGPFLGMNNRLPDTKLRTKDGAYVRNAVNVDFNTEGFMSFWSDGLTAFYVDYDTLYLLDAAMNRVALLTSLTPGIPMSYALNAKDYFCSNGIVIQRITDGFLYPAAVLTPQWLPTITIGDGSLRAGRYSFVFTNISEDGEESGSTVPIQLELPENSAVTFANIQGPYAYTGFYVTPLNGDQYYLASLLPTSEATLTLSVIPAQGRRCQTVLLAPMPPGNIVRSLNGRLLVASGNTLYYSEAYSPLYNPARNYVQFPVPITVVEPCNNGFYVCADQTYWVAGDILTAELNPVLPYGGILGTGCDVPNENAVFWMSPRGIVKGTQDGVVTNLQEGTNVVSSGTIGASLFREANGMKQLLVSKIGTANSAVLAARSWMEGEVIRKDTVL